MNPVIEENKSKIEALCRKHGVARLELFGSANTPEFDPERCDFDFIVDFVDYGEGISRRFFGFAHDMESLLKRDVDLVSPSKIEQKPRFLATIASTREVVFEVRSGDVAA